MTQLLKYFSVLFLITFLLGCSNTQYYEAKEIKIEGEFEHKNTNLNFPISWDNFYRESITSFNKDTSNIGVNYLINNSEHDLKISLYVYPAQSAFENRFRIEFFKCLQDISSVLNQKIISNFEHVIINRDGYKLIGLQSTFVSNNFNSVLVLFECGNYFLKYRISSYSKDTSHLKEISKKLPEIFSPFEIVKNQPLNNKMTISIAPSIALDSSSLKAVVAGIIAKSKWIYENVDSLEQRAGYPSLYFEEQKVTIDSMLNTWANIKHNNTIFDKYLNDLTTIRDSGFLNEYICDQYNGILLIPDYVDINWDKYQIWKGKYKPSVNLLDGEYYYLIGYKSSEEVNSE